jgi:hypothetical protein
MSKAVIHDFLRKQPKSRLSSPAACLQLFKGCVPGGSLPPGALYAW